MNGSKSNRTYEQIVYSDKLMVSDEVKSGEIYFEVLFLADYVGSEEGIKMRIR
jgi:hypothetical protein